MFGRRVLVLVPHPDDEVVGAATAIERLVARGGEAYAAYLTTGVPPRAGRWFGNESTYGRAVETRWQEATRVQEALGLQCAMRRSVPSRSLKSELASAFDDLVHTAERLSIDRIWTPAYEGGHQDHDVSNFLAAQVGARLADRLRVFEFAEYNFAEGRAQSQCFPEPTGRETLLKLDVDARERKRRLLSTYASERRNLGAVRFEREVFRPLADYDYDRPPHASPLFYQRFHWIPRHPRIDYCTPEEVCDALAHFRASTDALA